jgi:hypothetical protein
MQEPTSPSGAPRAFISNVAEGSIESLDGRWVLVAELVLCAVMTATRAHLPPPSSHCPYMAAMSGYAIAGDFKSIPLYPGMMERSSACRPLVRFLTRGSVSL